MHITFLVPCKDLSGGLRVVTCYGNELLRRGHQVTVVCPERDIPATDKVRRAVKRFIHHEKDHLDFFQGTLLHVPAITVETCPDADILIATAWHTAEFAKDFPASKGRKFYLVQGYETWVGDRSTVDATLRYPFTKIVISRWLKKIVEEVSGETNLPVIANGKDFHLSSYHGEGLARRFDVGMLYSPVAPKGTIHGLAAVQELWKEFPKLSLVMFGTEDPIPDRHPDFPFERVTFHRKPTQEEIRELYLSTRIWVSTSVYEGFCLPALEAISLGCVVVAANSLGVEDIITDGVNGFLVEPGKPEPLALKIAEILKDPVLEKRLALAGLRSSERFSWQESTNQLEAILINEVSCGD
jgi:glycosyltransferase involved in cell wall biosynthesis